MPVYHLDLACPVPWPENPNYPVDIQITQATSPIASTSAFNPTDPVGVPEAAVEWLRAVYLDSLFGVDKLQEVRLGMRGCSIPKGKQAQTADLERVVHFAKSLRCWLPPIPEDILVRAIEPLGECDKKWRTSVPQTIADPSQSDLQEDERSALLNAYRTFEAHNEAFDRDAKGKTRWRHVSQREWMTSLEFVEHQLQIVLLLEILSSKGLSDQVPPPGDQDHEAHLDLLTDRLAIRQALHGIGDITAHGSFNGAVADLDDVQRFWRDVVEAMYIPCIPRHALVEHRSKIFPSLRTPSPFSDNEEAVSDLHHHSKQHSVVPSSPFAHPTPNLMRLAKSVQEAQDAADQAQSAVPASPTLAKLLGVAPATKDDRRRFSRSKSSSVLLGARQVSLGPSKQSGSIELESQQKKAVLFGAKNKARTSKRKQASPKKSNAKTLVMATPNRTFARSSSLPNVNGSRPVSFAALGKAFRPGSTQQSGFDPVAEEGHVLIGETPQKSRHMEIDMEEALGTTPG